MAEYITTEQCEEVVWEVLNNMGISQKHNESTVDEVKVKTLQILVFRGDEIDAYGTIDNQTELTLSCTTGSRTVYAVVNGPDLSLVSSKTAFLATLHSLQDDNTLTSFMMTGSDTVTLPYQGKVHIEVSRVVAKITLQSIKRDFTSAALSAQGFTVKKVYLDNVIGGNNFGMTLACDTFFNEDGYKDELPAFTCSVSGEEIADGATLSQEYFFYAYPNDVSVKATRVVIEALQNGKTYYYHIPLPELESNHAYTIQSLTITRLGSDDPATAVQICDQEFEIEVMPWITETLTSPVI